jgi:hypothetical protein
MRRKLSDRRQLQKDLEQAERRVAIRRQAQDRRSVNTSDVSTERRAEEVERLQKDNEYITNLPIEP